MISGSPPLPSTGVDLKILLKKALKMVRDRVRFMKSERLVRILRSNRGRYKLIYSKDDGIEWVFDLEKDPEEQHPIVDRAVTSVFVDKLLRMLKEDEKRKIREIARKRSL